MSTNPYQAPESALVDAVQEKPANLEFYVVSSFKFWLLMIGTFGLYTLYWFYRHWSQQNKRHGGYWPVPRAIFSIFFTHSLFAQIEHVLKTRGIAFRWSPSGLATLYVFCSLVMHVSTRLANSGMISEALDTASILLMIPSLWALFVAQSAANVAEGDPDGAGNAVITGANIAWLVLGGLVWLLALLGMASNFVEI